MAERARREAGTFLRGLGLALLLVDAGSLALLLFRLGIAWWVALALGFGVGGATSYGMQWRFLLSRRAYRRTSNPLRYAGMLCIVLAVNLGGFYLIAERLFFAYLAVRLGTAVIVAIVWINELAAPPAERL